MDWEIYAQVMTKLGGLPLLEIPSFRDAIDLYGIAGAVRYMAIHHDLDERETLVIREMAARISPLWRWTRRRERRDEVRTIGRP